MEKTTSELCIMHQSCCVFLLPSLCVCVCVFEGQQIFSRYTALALPSTRLCRVYKKQLQAGLTEGIALLSGSPGAFSPRCHQDTASRTRERASPWLK